MGAGLNLDEWVPLASTAVRTRHCRAVDVEPEVLWRAA